MIQVLTVCLIGQIGFTLACWFGSYYAALIARIIFGLGSGTAVVAQGRLAAHWFVGKELVFAIALTESSHDVAQWIAKVYPVPMTHWFVSITSLVLTISIHCAYVHMYMSTGDLLTRIYVCIQTYIRVIII
jgi:hypothetical protein